MGKKYQYRFTAVHESDLDDISDAFQEFVKIFEETPSSSVSGLFDEDLDERDVLTDNEN